MTTACHTGYLLLLLCWSTHPPPPPGGHWRCPLLWKLSTAAVRIWITGMRGKSSGLSGDLTLRVTIRKRRMYRSCCAQLVKSVAGNSMISAQREVEKCGQGQRKVEVSRPRIPGFVVYSRAGDDFLKGEKPRDKSRLARSCYTHRCCLCWISGKRNSSPLSSILPLSHARQPRPASASSRSQLR